MPAYALNICLRAGAHLRGRFLAIRAARRVVFGARDATPAVANCDGNAATASNLYDANSVARYDRISAANIYNAAKTFTSAS